MDCILFVRKIQSLLEDDLTGRERRMILRHAEQCECCRRRLEAHLKDPCARAAAQAVRQQHESSPRWAEEQETFKQQYFAAANEFSSSGNRPELRSLERLAEPWGRISWVLRRGIPVAAAAVILIVVFGLVSLRLGQSPPFAASVAYGAMVDHVGQARTLTFAQREIGSETNRVLLYSVDLTKGRARVEVWEDQQLTELNVWTGDCCWHLDFTTQQAMWMEDCQPPLFPDGIQENVQILLWNDFTRYVGQQDVEGQKVQVYLRSGNEKAGLNAGWDVRIFMQPATQYPWRIVSETTRRDLSERVRVELTDFVWNQDLDPSLFEVQVPQDWAASELSTDVGSSFDTVAMSVIGTDSGQ